MKTVTKFVSLAFSLLLIYAPSANAKEVRVMYGSVRPPFFYIENGVPKGIEVNLMHALMRYMGHEMKEEYGENKLSETAIENGYDIAVSVPPTKPKGIYSDDFVGYVNYAISRKADRIKLNKIRDLSRYKIAAWQNAWRDLGPEFQSLYDPQKKTGVIPLIEFGNQIDQNHFFWNKKADVILIDKTIFQWLRNRLQRDGIAVLPDEALNYHAIFKSKYMFKVEFKDAALRDQFNAALAKIRSNGMYEVIVQSAIR